MAAIFCSPSTKSAKLMFIEISSLTILFMIIEWALSKKQTVKDSIFTMLFFKFKQETIFSFPFSLKFAGLVASGTRHTRGSLEKAALSVRPRYWLRFNQGRGSAE